MHAAAPPTPGAEGQHYASPRNASKESAKAVHAGTVESVDDTLAPFSPDVENELRPIALDVVDKQYRLYAWVDTKNQALITTNAMLFAVVGFLYKDCLRDALALLLLASAVMFIASSLITCLTQVLPRITSHKSGDEPNTRSLRGITLFKTWEDYRHAFMSASKSALLIDTVRQIYGMASNNMRSARILKRGVYLTSAGVILILGAIFINAGAARGVHLLGRWQPDDKALLPRNESTAVVSAAQGDTYSTSTKTNYLIVPHHCAKVESLVQRPHSK